jgi:hypothetical protein
VTASVGGDPAPGTYTLTKTFTREEGEMHARHRREMGLPEFRIWSASDDMLPGVMVAEGVEGPDGSWTVTVSVQS